MDQFFACWRRKWENLSPTSKNVTNINLQATVINRDHQMSNIHVRMFCDVRYFLNIEMLDVRMFANVQMFESLNVRMFDVWMFANFQMFGCLNCHLFGRVRMFGCSMFECSWIFVINPCSNVRRTWTNIEQKWFV